VAAAARARWRAGVGSQRDGLTGVGALVEIDPEYRAAECSQRESAALGVDVDLLAVAPARGYHVGGLSHVPAEGANVLFGEDRLQGAPTGQPGIVFEREKARPEQVTRFVVGRSSLGGVAGVAENVAGGLR